MSEKIEQFFQVSQPARLEVSNIRGSTEVRAGEDDVIHVEAVKQPSSGDEKRTEIQVSQQADGTVKVKTHFPEVSLGWLIGSQPCRVDYVITAPRACALKINGVSNDTLVEGFDGECAVNSVSGDLDLARLTGDLSASVVSGELELEAVTGKMKLNAVSGDISGKHLSGTLDLNTVSGNVELKESSLASLEANVTSGGVEVETALSEGPYRFHSVSGDVRLKVPPETHCTAELHSLSGGIKVGLPQASTMRRNGRQVAEVGGGGVLVYVNSVSGNLSLKS
ncbi:MAG: DUF4097 family beta strand repeat protein [Chloroflexi bacterium]|nr:DUF4097 family beta strand repeat protein [Chloroflexota bacterium]